MSRKFSHSKYTSPLENRSATNTDLSSEICFLVFQNNFSMGTNRNWKKIPKWMFFCFFFCTFVSGLSRIAVEASLNLFFTLGNESEE